MRLVISPLPLVHITTRQPQHASAMPCILMPAADIVATIKVAALALAVSLRCRPSAIVGPQTFVGAYALSMGLVRLKAVHVNQQKYM